MAKLYLAANYVTDTKPGVLVPNDLENSGHLQIVYENNYGRLFEIEVQGSWLAPLGVNFDFSDPGDDHTDETPYVGPDGQATNPNRYQRVELPLGANQTAGQVWGLLNNIHASVRANGAELDYDVRTQNSNKKKTPERGGTLRGA